MAASTPDWTSFRAKASKCEKFSKSMNKLISTSRLHKLTERGICGDDHRREHDLSHGWRKSVPEIWVSRKKKLDSESKEMLSSKSKVLILFSCFFHSASTHRNVPSIQLSNGFCFIFAIISFFSHLFSGDENRSDDYFQIVDFKTAVIVIESGS